MSEYAWEDSEPATNHSFLFPPVREMVRSCQGKRLLDLGCGNGAMTRQFAGLGYDVVGVDSAESGVAAALAAAPELDFRRISIDDPLPTDLASMDIVVSCEVIEHLYSPRNLFYRAREALSPQGRLVLSTPYHGYVKNLALAVTNSFDTHWSPGWDHGHIKFFSRKTLSTLAEECGFRPIRWDFAGRVRPVSASMILLAEPV